MGEAVVAWLKETAAQDRMADGDREEEDPSVVEQKKAALDQFTVESILSHIYYYRVHDYIEQVALLNTLPAFLKEHPTVPYSPPHALSSSSFISSVFRCDLWSSTASPS